MNIPWSNEPTHLAALNEYDVLDGEHEMVYHVGCFNGVALNELQSTEGFVRVQELHYTSVCFILLFKIADFFVEDSHSPVSLLIGSVVLGSHHVLCTFENMVEAVHHA